jgi:hypothetical protein
MVSRPELLAKEEGMRSLHLLVQFGFLTLAAGCMANPFDTRLPLSPVTDAKSRKQLFEAIRRKGGEVRVDSEDPNKSVLVADLHGFRDIGLVLDSLGPLTKLRELNLYDTTFTDADLERLRGLSNLQKLNLSATRVTDAGLSCLRTLPNLQSLYLNNTQVTDAGLVYLKDLPHLKDLALFRTGVTDQGLQLLGSMNLLQKLTFGGAAITDDGLAKLCGLSNLRELNIVRSRVTDSGIAHLKAALPQLRICR